MLTFKIDFIYRDSVSGQLTLPLQISGTPYVITIEKTQNPYLFFCVFFRENGDISAGMWYIDSAGATIGGLGIAIEKNFPIGGKVMERAFCVKGWKIASGCDIFYASEKWSVGMVKILFVCHKLSELAANCLDNPR